MKINFITIFLIKVTLLISLCFHVASADDLPSKYTENAIVVDGQLDDWSGVGAYFDKEKGISLSIVNDSSNLYIKLHTQDRDNVHAIKLTGLKIYLDNGKGDKKDFYIKYNGGPELNMPNVEDEPIRRRQEKKIEKNRFICYDKDRMLNKEIPTDGSQGPAAAYGEFNQVFVYEFKVPLHKSTTNSYGLEIDKKKKFKIGIVWGDRDDLPDGVQIPSRMRGGMDGFGGNDGFKPPSGGGGFGGRGGGMPPPGGRNKPGRMLIEKKEIWIKSKLASASITEQE